MFDLDLVPLVFASAQHSPIDIWKPPTKGQKNQKIQSIESEDVAECVNAAKKGASLYLTSSPDFRNTYGKALSYQMGYDFAGYFPGTTTEKTAGDSMCEIEIFISKKGNYTDFHMDFQENFTYQLKGSKKWRLMTEKGMEAPVLGFSPHFKNSSNLEMQTKGAQCYNSVDILSAYDKARLQKESTTVTLNEGDIMYHPAGIWHSVESVTDSISINFSMRQVRKADLIVNALRMHMFQDKDFREGIRFDEDDQDNT